MSFWDGSRWILDQSAKPTTPHSTRTANWTATVVMAIGLALLIAPLQLISAAPPSQRPVVAVSCDPSPCTVGGSLTVHGWGFAPSAGGQRVFGWLGYPDDYCGAAGCHGRYFHPWVNSDGTFSQTFTDVLMCTGSGHVTAYAYLVKRDKWVNVGEATFTVE
jgi:hypothetical protein